MIPSILMVDDEPATRFAFTKYLGKAGFSVREASSIGEAREALNTERFEAVLLDLNLPDGNGLDWMVELREIRADIAIIVITGIGDIPSAVEAMRRGADHFLTKPVNLADLEVFLRKSLEVGSLRRRNLANGRLATIPEPFLGHSDAMKTAVSFLRIAAESDATVLLQGETGTGKGIFARWIHQNSQRSSMSFVEVNCSSLRGELLSNELFGHARGAFTSAVENQQGLLEVADGGTLFLDEIGDMDPSVQSQFLKVLEEKRYRRLGDVKERRSEFRLLCATNRNLLDDVQQGRFRKDLYFRIHVIPIEIPPLRKRMQDLPDLVSYLLPTLKMSHKTIAPEAMQLLRNYPWPGNIRELRNVLERALLLAGREARVAAEHLPGLNAQELLQPAKEDQRDDRTAIEEAIRQSGGDTKKAAEQLGMSRATLYRRLKPEDATTKARRNTKITKLKK